MEYIAYKNSKITEAERQKNNKKYIEKQLAEQKEYFDKMFKRIDQNIILDENQRKIILNDEDYLMVIAGAGLGKTTTICAKVNYLIEKKNIKNEEILVISFTNKAVQELEERINKDFNHKIKIQTFHKFGYEIIKNNIKNKPAILTDNEKIIDEYIKKEIFKKNNLKKYIRYYPKYFENIKQKNIKKQIKELIQQIIKRDKTKRKKEKLIPEPETYRKFTNLCKTYITLYKSKGYKYKDFEKIVIKNKRTKIFIKFIKDLYIYYQEQLKQQNKIDFDDIINNANNILEKNEKINLKYKYIIIDEYQDISDCRFKLIKNISNKNNSKIMVVGDDWQCIYSFAASNINLFTQFKNNVEYCEILKIIKTYRNSQELINIAGDFIQKNNNQIKKNLISNKNKREPITVLKYKRKEIKQKLQETLDYLIKNYGEEKNILLLGRYNFDKNKIIDNEKLIDENGKIIYKKNPKIKIEFLTIHSSKGLGYDNVVIINNQNTKLGFPSKIKTDKILKQLITTEKNIKYAEERRLFYVALTRTKNEVILLSPTYKYSTFIKEIKKYKNIRIKNKL